MSNIPPSELSKEIQKYLQEYKEEIDEEYLIKLKKNNIKIGLATSSPKELYEPVLKNNKIYDVCKICGSMPRSSNTWRNLK